MHVLFVAQSDVRRKTKPKAVFLFLWCLFFMDCLGRVSATTKRFVIRNQQEVFSGDLINDQGYQDSTGLDTVLYNQKLLQLVHHQPSAHWPIKTAYPLHGAILPFERIVAYYGNLYSAGTGILGELPSDEMLSKLQEEMKKWEAADTLTPVRPALHYIAVTAQRSPGVSSKYRLRMLFEQIDRVLEMAKKIDALVFLDIQVGQSTLMEEIPLLKKYLLLPHVHLGIDLGIFHERGAGPGQCYWHNWCRNITCLPKCWLYIVLQKLW